MDRPGPGGRPAAASIRYIQRVARSLHLGLGEATELVERVWLGHLPEVQQRRSARALLDTYAARKRVIERLARCGRL